MKTCRLNSGDAGWFFFLQQRQHYSTWNILRTKCKGKCYSDGLKAFPAPVCKAGLSNALTMPVNAAHSPGIDMVFLGASSSRLHRLTTKHYTSSYCKVTSLSKCCRCEDFGAKYLLQCFFSVSSLHLCYYSVIPLSRLKKVPFVISTAILILPNTLNVFLFFKCF